MKEKETNVELCRNCSHFVEYYIRRKNYFQPTKKGYCSNEKANCKNKEICLSFELKKEERQIKDDLEGATKMLAVIQEMLDYICGVFKTYEQADENSDIK